jgi:hypothetical protein
MIGYPLRRLLTSLVAAASLAGCGGGSDESGTPPPPSTPAPTVSVGASPGFVIAGGTSTITWSSTNATSCSASGGWSGARAVSGSEVTPAINAETTFSLTCTGAGGTGSGNVLVSVSQGGAAAFPLRVSSNQRYLVDVNNQPFLIHGDTAWSLIADLTREDAEIYLQDRAARGFNTLLINLIEHKFSSDPPRNAYGDAPFLNNDIATPNTAYFAHADYVLGRARDLGFAVLLVPAYLGFGGGDEGFYQELNAAGNSALLAYGRFLGLRYNSYTNIVWTYGGDYNPPNRDTVRKIAEGIRENDTRTVSTAHTAPENEAADYWGAETWLTLNNIYTYNAVYTAALDAYARVSTLPFFLVESAYENENSATLLRLRTQAWHAVLSGAAGHVFGNNPIWHFDGPGVFGSSMTWEQALNSPGARSMEKLADLFSTVEWWTLQPDAQNELLTSGAGSDQNRAVASMAVNGSIAIAYIPTSRDTGFALSRLSGPRVSAEWYDPESGAFVTATGSPFQASGTQSLRAPAANGRSTTDWVLVLRSVP